MEAEEMVDVNDIRQDMLNDEVEEAMPNLKNGNVKVGIEYQQK